MRRPINKCVARVACVGVATVMLLGVGSVAVSHAQTAEPPKSESESSAPPASSPSAKTKSAKKSKKAADAPEGSPSAKTKKVKELPFPLSPGDPASRIKIPETDAAGNILSQLMAVRAVRLDNEHVQMNEMHLDLYHPDGKEDFHIVMPTSIFNIRTRLITSEDPVTIKTQDFELTGEKMEFNTIERTGKLIGKVRMVVYNLQQIAGPKSVPAKPE